MATVRQTATGKWQVVWSETRDGKRWQPSRTFDKKTKALAHKAKVETEIEARGIGDPDKLTVIDFLNRWHKGLEDRSVGDPDQLSPTTLLFYRHNINVASREMPPKLKLAKLTPAHLRDLYTRLLQRGGRHGKNGTTCPLAPRSVAHVHAMLKNALGQAVDDELIPKNPAKARNAKPPAVPVKSKKAKPFNPEQVATLLRLATEHRDPDRLVMVGTLLLGLRRGEVCGLSFDEDSVDLEKSLLHIHRTVISLAHNDWRVKEVPKTDDSVRTIKIPPALVELLRAQKARVLRMAAAVGPRYQLVPLYVFPGENGGPINPTYISFRCRYLLRKAGISSERHSPVHGWRHTVGNALFHGINVKAAQAQLGHSRPEITLALYTTALPEHADAAADMLGAMLAKTE